MRELALILFLSSFLSVSLALKEKVPCIENGKFYRNPNRHPDYVWSQTECAKYYLCIEDEVSTVSIAPNTIFAALNALNMVCMGPAMRGDTNILGVSVSTNWNNVKNFNGVPAKAYHNL